MPPSTHESVEGTGDHLPRVAVSTVAGVRVVRGPVRAGQVLAIDRTPAEVMNKTMSEADLQKRITDLCDWLHLKWHHETDSRKSKKGWPDLVVAGPDEVIFVELKTEKGRVSVEQQEWLDALTLAGATVFVWRPSDWPMIERRLRNMARGA